MDSDDTSQPARVALVTGTSTGLGEVLAEHLAGQGWRLVVTARGEQDLATVVERLQGAGAVVTAVPGDIGDPGHREQVMAAVAAEGRLDWLVNNASQMGVSPIRPLADHPLESLDIVLRTNVIGPVALIQLALPTLRRSHGMIVNLSSEAAVDVFPCAGIYGASKAALDQASRILAVELDGSGVGVVMVDPGGMRTRGYALAEPDYDRSSVPPPEVTLPFWDWLATQDPEQVNGRRFLAQSDEWTRETAAVA